MKHLKYFEHINKEYYNNYKYLAKSFVKLFTDIRPEMKYKVKKTDNGYSVNNIYNYSLLEISRWTTDKYEISLFSANIDNDILLKFILYVFDVNWTNFSGMDYLIPIYIGKLTKENYDNYIIKLTTDKYNL